jgi:ribosomal protein S18 acetylase RimI-like enzyme
MNLNLKAMVDCDISEVADVLNRGFADYFVKIEITAPVLFHMVAHDSIDLGESRVVLRDNEMVAAALVARRGWNCRLAAMAAIPEARDCGIGSWLTGKLLAESRARGERKVELEVIEANAAGVHVYKKNGFRTLRRLLSFSLSDAEGGQAAELREVDIREVAVRVTAHGLPDLPWQISGESLAQTCPPSRAFNLRTAYMAISNPSEQSIAIRSLVVEPESRRRGEATRLLRALLSKFPGKTWNVPALCPEEIGSLFESLGFVPGSLSQFHMVSTES